MVLFVEKAIDAPVNENTSIIRPSSMYDVRRLLITDCPCCDKNQADRSSSILTAFSISFEYNKKIRKDTEKL